MRCKPGDLAVIIGSDFQENIGRFVNVVSIFNINDPKYGLEWNCVSVGSPLMAYRGKGRGKTMKLVSSDSDLRPINPPPEESTIEAVREVSA